MSDIIALGAIAICAAPLFYLQIIATRAIIEIERSQYDDSDCEPGFTNYPGPM